MKHIIIHIGNVIAPFLLLYQIYNKDFAYNHEKKNTEI